MTRATRQLVPSETGLSFVRDIVVKGRRGHGRVWWAPTPPKGLTKPGAYTRGCEDGEKLAAEAVGNIADMRDWSLLGVIADDAIASRKGKPRSKAAEWNSGAVVGFFHEIAKRAAWSASIMRALTAQAAELQQTVDTTEQSVRRIMPDAAPGPGIGTRRADATAKRVVVSYAAFKKRRGAKRHKQTA